MIAIVAELFVGVFATIAGLDASILDCEVCSVGRAEGAIAKTLSLFWAWRVARQASSPTKSFTVISREGGGMRLRS